MPCDNFIKYHQKEMATSRNQLHNATRSLLVVVFNINAGHYLDEIVQLSGCMNVTNSGCN